MSNITRREFLSQAGILGASMVLLNGCGFQSKPQVAVPLKGVILESPLQNEGIFAYIKRQTGGMDQTLYRQIIGAANPFKEGDLTLGVAAENEDSRTNARKLLSQTSIQDLSEHSLYEDQLSALIQATTQPNPVVQGWTMGELKAFVLESSEEEVKRMMPSLSSDVIACLIKLMSNEELIAIGQKVFNPLPNSKIGSKGYMGARVQPNSPTDNPEDIQWQVFNAWAYGVGDLVLGTNPVSSEPESVAKIESTLFDILTTFQLEKTLPNCVLSHIDIQAAVEEMHPGTTGVWFQSIAGTVNANQTFDVTIDKMFQHIEKRQGQYGLYAETGQGADFTNGHGEGFDMLVHEARKYGFIRAMKAKLAANRPNNEQPWVFANDVAGFIGPEVFRTREQLVRCCLEDIAMGKLHGLTIGLDICSTLHMDIDLDDLDWCIEQIMPANPAYLMALPTKNDPMLSYLTTAFNNHVKVREQFGYKVNDAMWDFFKKIEVIDPEGKPTANFGDPIWVYYQYCKAQSDPRSKKEIYEAGRAAIKRIRDRGVPIAEGYGDNIWDLEPSLDKEVRALYEDAKVSLWTEMHNGFMASIPNAIMIHTQSTDRQDYVYHPETGEKLTDKSIEILNGLANSWQAPSPDVQIIVSDGLNARALMDEGHLAPFLGKLGQMLKSQGFTIGQDSLVMTHGRVRAGYACGELLFGNLQEESRNMKGIIHIIGERPGSGHHNFSAYITAAPIQAWKQQGKVDHDISRVISGISDTALLPQAAAQSTVKILQELWEKNALLG